MKEEMDEIKLDIELLEERIAPSAHGSLGYEGQPGNQGNGLLVTKAILEIRAAATTIRNPVSQSNRAEGFAGG